MGTGRSQYLALWQNNFIYDVYLIWSVRASCDLSNISNCNFWRDDKFWLGEGEDFRQKALAANVLSLGNT